MPLRLFSAKFALLLVIALPAAQVAAQDAVADAPVSEPTTADILTLGSDIPGRLTVPVMIGTAGPYPFTIDTGSERTVISRELARLLGLVRGRDVRVTTMTGASSVATVIIPSLGVSSIGGERIEAPTFNGSDLGAPGLLGLDALQARAVSIDFDTNQMRILPASKRTRRQLDDPDTIVIRARSLFGQLVVTDASFRGQRVRVVLDTGSAVSVGNLALKRRVSLGGRGMTPLGLMSVTGARLATEYAQIGAVTIGSVTFNNLPVAFADAAPFARFGLLKRPALLLGIDALRQFRRVDIDFANREVRLSRPRARG